MRGRDEEELCEFKTFLVYTESSRELTENDSFFFFFTISCVYDFNIFLYIYFVCVCVCVLCV